MTQKTICDRCESPCGAVFPTTIDVMRFTKSHSSRELHLCTECTEDILDEFIGIDINIIQ